MSIFCELCGRQVIEGRKTVLIDGTIFNVCMSCSKRGKPYVSAGTPKRKTTIMPTSKKTNTKIQMTMIQYLALNLQNLLEKHDEKRFDTRDS